MEFKSDIMTEKEIRRTLVRISHEIIENNKGTDNLCLVGILRRGKPLADIIKRNIESIEGVDIPCGELDISFYRDDLTTTGVDPTYTKAELPFDITGRKVVLVDDVLYTARRARAAIEALFSIGRPGSIQLAVMVDRGHREIPVKAEYVGKNIPTSRNEMIKVSIPPYDSEMNVALYGL